MIKEVPKETIKEVPVEVIKEVIVQAPYEVIKEIEVEREVIREVCCTCRRSLLLRVLERSLGRERRLTRDSLSAAARCQWR